MALFSTYDKIPIVKTKIPYHFLSSKIKTCEGIINFVIILFFQARRAHNINMHISMGLFRGHGNRIRTTWILEINYGSRQCGAWLREGGGGEVRGLIRGGGVREIGVDVFIWMDCCLDP